MKKFLFAISVQLPIFVLMWIVPYTKPELMTLP